MQRSIVLYWRQLETIRAVALRARCSLSVVFFRISIKKLPQQSIRWSTVSDSPAWPGQHCWPVCRGFFEVDCSFEYPNEYLSTRQIFFGTSCMAHILQSSQVLSKQLAVQDIPNTVQIQKSIYVIIKQHVVNYKCKILINCNNSLIYSAKLQ